MIDEARTADEDHGIRGMAYGWNDMSGVFYDALTGDIKTIAERFCGENVIETYDCFRVYAGPCGLPVHVDRLACDISVAVNLWADVDWPLMFWENGGVTQVNLQPGMFVIYEGCKTPHWRSSITLETDKTVAQVFFHYIRGSHPMAPDLAGDSMERSEQIRNRALLGGREYDSLVREIGEKLDLEYHIGH